MTLSMKQLCRCSVEWSGSHLVVMHLCLLLCCRLVPEQAVVRCQHQAQARLAPCLLANILCTWALPRGSTKKPNGLVQKPHNGQTCECDNSNRLQLSRLAIAPCRPEQPSFAGHV